MKFLVRVYCKTRPCVSLLTFLVPGFLLFGCVSLDKPSTVKACASAPQGCSDEHLPAKRDAAITKDAPSNDDLPSVKDTLVAQSDLPSTTPDLRTIPDLATDILASDTGSADTSDGRVGAEVNNVPEAGIGDLSLLDLATRDLLRQDLLGPDLPSPDLASPDLPAPDLPTDPPTPDSQPDIAADLGRDLARNDTGSGNCISQIIASGYASGTAPTCSACNDGNGNSLATKCTGMLDCLAPPKTSADFITCLNAVGGSSKVRDCVNALTTAGCPAGY
jgi:hypothetical protein